MNDELHPWEMDVVRNCEPFAHPYREPPLIAPGFPVELQSLEDIVTLIERVTVAQMRERYGK